MKIILLENIAALGQLGDVVNVRAGYARNYLFPQKKAELAEPASIKAFEQRRAELAAKQTQREEAMQQAHARLDGYSLPMVTLASPDGNLYGSITAQIIATVLNEQKLIPDTNIKRSQIILEEGALKSLGGHKVGVKLSESLTATITIELMTEMKQSQPTTTETTPDDQ